MRVLFDHGPPAPLQSFPTGHTIAIVVLGNAQWPIFRLHVVAAVNAATPGTFTEVNIPVD